MSFNSSFHKIRCDKTLLFGKYYRRDLPWQVFTNLFHGNHLPDLI